MQLDINRNSQHVLTIGGVAATALVDAHPTPFFAYDFGAMAATKQAYDTALKGKNIRLFYACKALNTLGVMRFMRGLGTGVDIVSGGELEKVLAAGFTPQDIVYSGVGKKDAELIRAIELDVYQINSESAEEVVRIAEIATRLNKRPTVALRVNPDVDAVTHVKITTGKKENKFGMTFDLARQIYAQYGIHKHINLCGLSMHIGSQLMDLTPFRDAYARLASLVTDLRANGHTVTRLDLGGGIGIAYHPADTVPSLAEYAQIISDTVENLGCTLFLEPGRSIVGNAGYVIAKIIEIKTTADIPYMILDAAMNDLMRPAMYDSYHHIVPLRADPAREQVEYSIAGPICESSDTFVKHHTMQRMEAGEYVVICSAGAYGTSMSSTYNLRPLTAEYACENGKTTLIRRAQKLEAIWADEI